MYSFDHKRLDVYRAAIAFVGRAHRIAKRIPRYRSSLSDQLLRAATSIPLNIAEGAGEHSRREKARFYRIARRSAAECAAILDVLVTTNVLPESEAAKHELLLGRIAAMLTKLTKSLERTNVASTPASPRPSPSPSPKP